MKAVGGSWGREGAKDTEGAEPACVEDERLWGLMSVDDGFGETGGDGVEFL